MAKTEAKKLVKALKDWALSHNKSQYAVANLLKVDRARPQNSKVPSKPASLVFVLLSLPQRHRN